MPDDRLGDTLRLLPRRDGPGGCAVPRMVGGMLRARLQDLEGEKAAVELEAQPGLARVLVCCAEVMEQAGEEVGLVCEGPGGKGVAFDGEAEVVDAEGVVVGLLGEIFAGVVVYASCEGGRWDGSLSGWDERGW